MIVISRKCMQILVKIVSPIRTRKNMFFIVRQLKKKYKKERKKKEKANGKKNEDLKNFGKHSREYRQAGNTRIRKRTRERKKNEKK